MKIASYKKTRAKEGKLYNEDSFFVSDKLRFYAIADGVSELSKDGTFNGREASMQCVSAAGSILNKDRNMNLEDLIRKLRDNVFVGGTTFTAARINDEDGDYSLDIVHVGDSKAYLIKNNMIEKLTDEHVNEEGKLNQALGPDYKGELKPFYRNVPLRAGDKIVLASDGVDLEDNKILKEVRKNPRKSVEYIIRNSGKEDDASVIVIDIEDPRYVLKSSAIKKTAAYISASLLIGGLSGLFAGKNCNKNQEIMEKIFEKNNLEIKTSMTSNIPKNNESNENTNKYVHVVKKEDNLWNIVKERYNLSDEKDIAEKVNEIAELNSEKYPNLKIDKVYVDNKVVRKGKDGIKGDLIYPGQEIELPQEQASVDIELDLIESYSNATLQNADDVIEKGMENFYNHVRDIADFYSVNGKEDTLDMFSMLDDESELRKVLSYAWNEINHERKTNISMINYEELEIIKDAYFSGTNEEALKKIKRNTGINMSEKSMYRALDKLGKINGCKYRKRRIA